MEPKQHRIGIWMPNWVGDACMATPALRSLADSFRGNAQLIGIMKPVIRDVISSNPWLDRTVVFSRKASAGVVSRIGLVRTLKSLQLDIVILLTNSFWTAAVSRLAGARRIIGYCRDGRGWLLTDRAAVPSDGKKRLPISPVDYYLELARYVGCLAQDRRMRLAVDDEDQQRAEQLWRQLSFDANVPTIVINSSGATAPSRLWPAEHVESLAARIVADHPWQVLMHCGPAERQSCNASALRVAHPRVQSMGEAAELPMALSKGVMKRASVVVSTDSGPRHLAIALDRPVITLFGSTDPTWTTTYNDCETLVEESLECRPCWATTCPLAHQNCMRQLSPDRVYHLVVSTMHRNRAAGARDSITRLIA